MNLAIAAEQGAALLVFALFAAVYNLLAGWRRSPTGWHVMALALGVAALSASGLASTVFGDYPGRQWVRLVLLLGLIGLGVWQILLLVQAQLGRREKPDA